MVITIDEIDRIVLVSTLEGTILEHAIHPFELTIQNGISRDIETILEIDNRQIFKSMLNESKTKELMSNEPISLVIGEKATRFWYSAIKSEDTIFFLISTTNEKKNPLLLAKEVVSFYEKKIEDTKDLFSDKLNSVFEQKEEDKQLFLEITKLNNELTNMQRNFTKKNYLLNETLNKLDEANKKIETFIESVPSGIIVVNSKGYISLINESANYYVSHTTKVSVEKKSDLKEFDGLHPLFDFFNEIIKVPRETIQVLEIIPKQEWIQIESKIVPFDFEEPQYLIFSINDVSEFKKFELIRNKFVSMVSHELKNPLSVINLSNQILEKHHDADEEIRKRLLNNIYNNTRLMIEIVEDLLLVSRLDEKGVKINFENVRVLDVIKELVESMELVIKKNKVALNVKIEPNTQVVVDRSRISQVFRIMLDNAIKFSEKNGVVEIKVESNVEREFDDKKRQYVSISFTDQGIGIPPEKVKNIFERFYRAHDSSEREGSGLGLSIAKELVELHEGKIMVESELGKGSSFTIYLPK